MQEEINYTKNMGQKLSLPFVEGIILPFSFIYIFSNFFLRVNNRSLSPFLKKKNLYLISFIRSFFEDCEPDYYYWRLVIIIRKALVPTITVVLANHPIFQVD